MKKLILLILFFLSIILAPKTFAQSPAFISIINPVRGTDFWELGDQGADTVLLGQISILNEYGLPATWLLRFDALDNEDIVNLLKKRSSDETGLFLEVTPTWTDQAGVGYRKSDFWHSAGSAFLTGYQREEREKLIDAAFEKFKNIFGQYPVSVGAWWIDSYSLQYMQEKYGIIAALIVADQYSTDNYQVWGQYFGTPYYPAKNNALHPAQSLENKLDVVMMQWAVRDPVNGYGNGVTESTFSVQANDYIDYHNLDTSYFSRLLDIYTKQKFNQFAQVVVGLENSYSWKQYAGEYKKQIEVLVKKKNSKELSVTTMRDFALWYKNTFPKLSPAHLIAADDPLGSFKKTIWFANPYYRAGWFLNSDGSVFRDIRQYIDGEEELCFKTRCDSVNFATSATRVLDDVSFGHKLILDQGKIKDFKVDKLGEEFVISYTNEGGNSRGIFFLPRDIKIDEKVSSIDELILNATKFEKEGSREKIELEQGFFKWSFGSVFLNIIKFLGFLLLGCFIPGFLLINKIKKDLTLLQKISISITLGFVLITLIFYVTSLLNLNQLIFGYFLISFLLLIKQRMAFLDLFKTKFRLDPLAAGIILLGTIFQQMPAFKNGLRFPFGIGFWGPNTHDGIWHISLINELIKSVPPGNPVFAGEVLKNYHYFYDLLVGVTAYATGMPVMDLVFRFFPLVFSLLLGIGTYYLVYTYFGKMLQGIQMKITVLMGLYLVYFAGSFGWIVEFIRERHLGGESAFWANQSISFNLNPPFAISLIIIIAFLQLLPYFGKNTLSIIVATILAGSLIVFKAYGGVIVILSLLLVGILKRSVVHLAIFLTSTILSAVLFLANVTFGEKLIMFSPFWFIHSMVDSPDRVGWVRLSLARTAGLETKNWFKFFSSEVISLLVFLIGNLGTRFFALFSLSYIKTIFKRNELLFIFFFSLLSLFIPIFFIQAGNPWNTIQFIYYFLYISAVISAVVISQIFKLNRIIGTLIIILVIIFTPINSWVTASGYLSYQPHARVSSNQLEALEFLRSQKDGIILTYPFDIKLKQIFPEPWSIEVYDSTGYVSAFTAKSVFLEDEPQNQILLTDYKKRLVASKDFFLKPTAESTRFLQDNNIKYVYLPKIFNTRLDEGSNLIENIFENGEVVVYQVK